MLLLTPDTPLDVDVDALPSIEVGENWSGRGERGGGGRELHLLDVLSEEAGAKASGGRQGGCGEIERDPILIA